MRLPLAFAPLLAAALAVAFPGPAQADEAAPKAAPTTAKEPPKETPLAVVNGAIRAAELDAHTLVIESAGGAETLRVDRNTLVYLPGGLSTVAALRKGDVVRAARNAAGVAYWIEVRRPGSPAPAAGAKGER